MTDLCLAIGHHLLVGALVAVLAFEIGVTREDIGTSAIAALARVDLWYGIVAAALLALGVTRAACAAKGWTYYSGNIFFWAKIGTFLVIGLLSIVPTVTFIRWRRASIADPTFAPATLDIRYVRGFLVLEALLFVLLPIFAAAMARGYGS